MSLELVIIEGPQAGRRLELSDQPLLFGRSADAAVSFPLDNFMSGRHLTAQLISGGVLLTDQRSTNGSTLNGQPFQQTRAVVGDILKVGTLVLQIAERPSPVESAVFSSPLSASIAPAEPPASSPQIPRDIATSPVEDTNVDGPGPMAVPHPRADVLKVLTAAQTPLFCLLDAAADEMIPSLLAVAQEPRQCLYDGESAITLARWAPFLVQLPPDAPILPILLEKGWGKGWSSYFTCSAPFDEVRKHFRRFLMVQVEGGRELYFRFYDPRVLRDFLPTANADERTMFFGPVSGWMLEPEDGEGVLCISNASEGLQMEIAHRG